MTDYKIDHTLDTSGFFCPEPLMMVHDQVRKAAAGEIIKVIATDPTTQKDIVKFCHFLGHELLEKKSTQQQYTYIIRKVS